MIDNAGHLPPIAEVEALLAELLVRLSPLLKTLDREQTAALMAYYADQLGKLSRAEWGLLLVALARLRAGMPPADGP